VRRREARKSKAAAAAPRPVGLLRPTVRGQSERYNAKAKQGRGFSLAELKAAGLTPAAAGTIGIAVDHRRVNKSEESLAANKARLQAYLATVVVAKRKVKGADASTVPTIGTATSAKGLGAKAAARVRGAPRAALLDLSRAEKPFAPAKAPAAAPGAKAAEFVAVSETLKKAQAYRTLRQEWINMRLKGKRDKVKVRQRAPRWWLRTETQAARPADLAVTVAVAAPLCARARGRRASLRRGEAYRAPTSSACPKL